MDNMEKKQYFHTIMVGNTKIETAMMDFDRQCSEYENRNNVLHRYKGFVIKNEQTYIFTMTFCCETDENHPYPYQPQTMPQRGY